MHWPFNGGKVYIKFVETFKFYCLMKKLCLIKQSFSLLMPLNYKRTNPRRRQGKAFASYAHFIRIFAFSPASPSQQQTLVCCCPCEKCFRTEKEEQCFKWIFMQRIKMSVVALVLTCFGHRLKVVLSGSFRLFSTSFSNSFKENLKCSIILLT